MIDTNLSRTTAQRTPATSHTRQAGEQTGQMAQAFKRAAADHAHIAQRAYELYEQRGRQEGRALEDWLQAERELVGAVHHA
jgi:outer membrane protein TolC